jgi:RHS repeat-associated protein
MAASYRYDAYGNTVTASGSLAGANVYRFSSKEFLVNSGLSYYGYRFYDPNLQRWLNRDPIGEEGGINLYTFSNNNAPNRVDYFGWLGFGTPGMPHGPGGLHRRSLWEDGSVWEEFWNVITDPEGYSACYAKCMALGTGLKGLAEFDVGAELGRLYYTAKYPKWFKAGGRFSKVLVPRLALRLGGGLAVLGLCEVPHCIERCLEEDVEKEPSDLTLPLVAPYFGGPVNTPPTLRIGG